MRHSSQAVGGGNYPPRWCRSGWGRAWVLCLGHHHKPSLASERLVDQPNGRTTPTGTTGSHPVPAAEAKAAIPLGPAAVGKAHRWAAPPRRRAKAPASVGLAAIAWVAGRGQVKPVDAATHPGDPRGREVQPVTGGGGAPQPVLVCPPPPPPPAHPPALRPLPSVLWVAPSAASSHAVPTGLRQSRSSCSTAPLRRPPPTRVLRSQ